MKKIFGTSAILVAGTSLGLSQGLYNIATLDDEYESSPLKWTAGLNFHYDDNVTPLATTSDEDATSLEAFVGARAANSDARTTWSAYLQVGYLYYLEDVNSLNQRGYENIYAGFDFTRRISERLRFVSRNSLSYALEPDYSVGIVNTRTVEQYLNINTDQAIGYRWSQRLATYTGVRGTFISYDQSGLDRDIYEVYHSFRYQISPQTVGTFEYRYGITEADGIAADSTNQYLLAGIEHRFSPTSIVTIRAGAQLRDVDQGGEDSTSPYVEAGVQSRLSARTSLRGFVRYGVEDYQTFANGLRYDTVSTLRAGLKVSHQATQDLTLFAGIDYVDSEFEDSPGAPGADFDEDLINYSIGFSYQINQGMALTGAYNFTDVSSSLPAGARDYDRSRLNIGIRAEF